MNDSTTITTYSASFWGRLLNSNLPKIAAGVYGTRKTDLNLILSKHKQVQRGGIVYLEEIAIDFTGNDKLHCIKILNQILS